MKVIHNDNEIILIKLDVGEKLPDKIMVMVNDFAKIYKKKD